MFYQYRLANKGSSQCSFHKLDNKGSSQCSIHKLDSKFPLNVPFVGWITKVPQSVSFHVLNNKGLLNLSLSVMTFSFRLFFLSAYILR